MTHAGQVLSKDALIEAVWPDVAATDNSLEQAISNLRRTLSSSCIETQARRGYRFIAEVTRLDRRESDEGIDALMAPHRAWLEGARRSKRSSAIRSCMRAGCSKRHSRRCQGRRPHTSAWPMRARCSST